MKVEHPRPGDWGAAPTEPLHGVLRQGLAARRGTAGAFYRPEIRGSTVAVAPDATFTDSSTGLGRASEIMCRACGKPFPTQRAYSAHLASHTEIDMVKSFGDAVNLVEARAEQRGVRADLVDL